MMMNDRWTIMNNSSSELDGKRPNKSKQLSPLPRSAEYLQIKHHRVTWFTPQGSSSPRNPDSSHHATAMMELLFSPHMVVQRNLQAKEIQFESDTHQINQVFRQLIGQLRCCSFLLWCVVLLVIIAAVVMGTVFILYLNQNSLPFMNRGRVSSSPAILTNPKESGALVSVSHVADGEPISIFLDPNCPDYTDKFLHWEALQNSLLRVLSNHNADDWQETGLVQKLTEELKVLIGHAHNLRLDVDSLKRGQGVLNQRLDGLQSEQSQILQMLSESHSGVLKLAAGFTDSLLSLQRETESLRGLNTELQLGSKIRADRPRDCSDIMEAGVSQDGVYSVFPTHDPDGFMVYCDMTTEGGGWTVIQRREDGSVNFFRGWEAYRDGFGKTTGEHWLGLQRIYSLTRSGGHVLRIDMADFDNATAFARYADFSVGRDSVNPEEDGYPLTVDQYSGTAGDSLLKHSGMQFTTKDRDQDQSENNCAAYYQGAWWYRNCHTSNLNGQYLRGGHASYADGVEWSSWTGWQYSLRFTEMKIRPNTKLDS